MRVQLEKINEIRQIFYGTFVRLGYKKHHEKTVLLANILDTSGKLMSDHGWFNYTKGFQEIEPLVREDKIRFCARVKQYRKGSIRRGIPVEYDYRLSHPSKIRKINKSVKTTPEVKIKEQSKKRSKFIEQDFDLDKFNYKIIMEETDVMNINTNTYEDLDTDEDETTENNSDELSESDLLEYEVDGEEKLLMDHINLAKIEEKNKIDPVENFLNKFNCIRKEPELVDEKHIITKEDDNKDQYIKLIENHLEEKFTSCEDKIIYEEIEEEIELVPPSILYGTQFAGHNLKQSSIQNFVKRKKLSLLPINKPRKQQVQSRLEYYFK